MAKKALTESAQMRDLPGVVEVRQADPEPGKVTLVTKTKKAATALRAELKKYDVPEGCELLVTTR